MKSGTREPVEYHTPDTSRNFSRHRRGGGFKKSAETRKKPAAKKGPGKGGLEFITTIEKKNRPDLVNHAKEQEVAEKKRVRKVTRQENAKTVGREKRNSQHD